jgi:teichuronic acid biosynthesis glycosyltransferase TuaC
MLRVLTLSTLFPDSSRPGFGNFVERQTLALAARGDVALEVVAPIGLPLWPLSLHPNYRERARLPEREIWKTLVVHRPRFTVTPWNRGATAKSLARALLPVFRTIRARFPFEIVDAEFFWPDGVAAARLGAALGVPVSVKGRGSDIDHWGRHPDAGPQMIEAAAGAQGLLAVSAALKARMIALGMNAEKIQVHHTGVDSQLFRPRDRDAAKAALGVEGPLIATVGALIPLKGHDLALAALAAIPQATLLIVGDGPERRRLERVARRLGVSGRARFLGARPHEELAAILAAADVMLLASKREGLANVWVEALACGTSIVIAETGAAREVVDRPEAGRVAAREPEALAAAVCEILADPPAPEAVRAAALRFSWQRNSDELFRHLSNLAERH